MTTFAFYSLKVILVTCGDVRQLSQTGKLTGDRLAFSDFQSSSNYILIKQTGSLIELSYNFYIMNWILDHQIYIISQINLNIGWVRFS